MQLNTYSTTFVPEYPNTIVNKTHCANQINSRIGCAVQIQQLFLAYQDILSFLSTGFSYHYSVLFES